MFYFKERVPADLVDVVRGRSVSVTIQGAPRRIKLNEFAQVTLRTKDPAEAKLRCKVVSASIASVWGSARDARGNSPDGTSPTKADDAGSKGWPGPMPWSRAFERFEALSISALRDLGFEDSLGSRAAVVGEMKSIYDSVGRAQDYAFGWNAASPRVDDATDRSAPSRASASMSVERLWEKWQRVRGNDYVASATITRYTASVKSFASFVGDKDLLSITADDIYEWAVHRRDFDGINPSVVNKNDIVAISSILGWASRREGGRVIEHNPARGIRLDVRRKEATRERVFRDSEIRAILGQALAVLPSSSNPTLSRALRWCPWLAAYSGARITELTQLHVEDIRLEQGTWMMEFRRTKTGEPRAVPIHEHVLAQGFLQVLREVRSGPIFVDPSRRRNLSAKSTLAQARSQDVADWVRRVSKLDQQLSPNHGWRHTFKTRALGRMDQRVSDAITGHRQSKVARTYETPSLKMMADALAQFPRYDIDRDAA